VIYPQKGCQPDQNSGFHTTGLVPAHQHRNLDADGCNKSRIRSCASDRMGSMTCNPPSCDVLSLRTRQSARKSVGTVQGGDPEGARDHRNSEARQRLAAPEGVVSTIDFPLSGD
jgi:hypothetical protein